MTGTGIDLITSQEEIADYVKDNINWLVITGGVADARRLASTNGVQDPFVVLRFSDDMPSSRGGSFMGSRYDEYYSYMDALCVADNDVDARRLANMVKDLVLGRPFTNTGAVSKNYGGGLFAQEAENTVPEYYIAVSAFRYTTNMIADGTGFTGG